MEKRVKTSRIVVYLTFKGKAHELRIVVLKIEDGVETIVKLRRILE